MSSKRARAIRKAVRATNPPPELFRSRYRAAKRVYTRLPEGERGVIEVRVS